MAHRTSQKGRTVRDGTPRQGRCSHSAEARQPVHRLLLGTPSTPDQFILRTRDEAVSQALAYAKRQHVRAWFAKGDDDFVLLGTFREEQAQPARSS